MPTAMYVVVGAVFATILAPNRWLRGLGLALSAVLIAMLSQHFL